MLKGVLGGACKLVKLGFLAFQHHCLCFKICLSGVNLVAAAGYVALLLVELQFTLLDACFRLLHLGES